MRPVVLFDKPKVLCIVCCWAWGGVVWGLLWLGRYCGGLRLFYNVVVRCLVVFTNVLCVLLMCLGFYSCICGVCKGDKMMGGWREF